MNCCFPVSSVTKGSENNFCFLLSFFFFKVSLPQTTKEPVSEVRKMTGVRAFLLLLTILA